MNIFDHIKNITTNKGPYLGDEGWNNWMINRYLSMDQDYVEVVNIVQKNTWQMKGEYLYNLYKDLIPKQYKFLKYIKPTKKVEYNQEEVDAVSTYFEVSKKQAKEYISIAYIKVDSLAVNYDFAQEMHDSFVKQQEAFTKEYGEKRSRFESQAADFQEKLQRGGFLSQERAMQERDRLMGEEQQITKLDQELSTKLAQIQADNNKQLLDSIMNYVKIYNKDKKFKYIFNSAEILVGDEAYNITKEILVGLNARYSKSRLK